MNNPTMNKDYFYIDATHMRNIKGEYMVGRNHFDRFRKSSKLHMIIDSNSIPIAFTFISDNVNDSTQTNTLAMNIRDKIIPDYYWR